TRFSPRTADARAAPGSFPQLLVQTQALLERASSKSVNAVVERFFATLKSELIYRHVWPHASPRGTGHL
ncbi:MAG: hypothetical protein ABJA34_13560, partial [Pseudonocardiales bacterium]